MQVTRRTFIGTALAFAAGAPALARQCVPGGGVWLTAAPLPVRTQEIYPAVLDGRIYQAGGLSPDAPGGGPIGILDRAFVWTEERGAAERAERDECLRPNAWREIAPLPEARHHANLVAHDGAIYAIGGFRAGNGGAWEMLTSNTRYDPQADAWTEMAPLPAPFSETVAASLSTGIHVVTGRQPLGEANANWADHGDSAAHYIYDARTDSWRDAAPNPHPRNSAAGAVIAGRLHVAGGRRVGDGNEAWHEAYDPVSGTWRALAPMPQGQGGLAAAAAHGRLHVFGGEYFDAEGGGVFAEVWIYDPDGEVWTAGPPMRTPRHGLGGVAIDDRVFAIAGATGPSAEGTSNLMDVLLP